MHPLPKNMVTGIHHRLGRGPDEAASRGWSLPELADSQTAGNAKAMPAHWPHVIPSMPSTNAKTNTGMAMDNFDAMVATETPSSWEHRAVNWKRG